MAAIAIVLIQVDRDSANQQDLEAFFHPSKWGKRVQIDFLAL